jgi:transcriptional regulator with XRE-family HTH domain
MATVESPSKAGRPRTWEPCQIGRNIETVCGRKRIRLDDLAASAGISVPTLYRIVGGQTPDPKVSTLKAIADALDVTVDRLIRKRAEPSRGPSRSVRRPA